MATLTQCEYQVANEVAKGQTPDEIANLLKNQFGHQSTDKRYS